MTIAHRRFELRRDEVRRAMQRVLPEPVTSHFVVVNQRRYPPKQVLAHMTGLDRADFTTHHARRILTGLGFPAGRRNQVALPEAAAGAGDNDRVEPPQPRAPTARQRPSAEDLEPFVGQWVATKGRAILVAAREPRLVVGWLATHDQRAESMFRVPAEEFAASGLAPL